MSELAIVCAILALPFTFSAINRSVDKETRDAHTGFATIFMTAAIWLGIAGAIR